MVSSQQSSHDRRLFNLITNNLFLGSIAAAKSPNELKCAGVTHIISVGVWPASLPSDITSFKIEIEDNLDADIY